MKRAREAADGPKTAESLLQAAMAARNASSRARLARQGLASRSPIDPTTQCMLLRQLYLSHFEEEHFLNAQEIAEQMLNLNVLPDVCRQDLARVQMAMGDIESAIGNLRVAARVGPANRRAFHYWTLGTVQLLDRRYAQAKNSFVRALRWATSSRPLYQAQYALACLEAGEAVENISAIIAELENAPCGEGYGRFVLGLLCVHAGRVADGHRYLGLFISRTLTQRKALTLALAGEVDLAQKHLEQSVVH
jgi:tetratricopeptide (TPR) repeat protein